ncbi:YwiC-like family protein [Paenibacillus fonticola]|uniref:YwiC-like family protein n=1 Tax=Paenibacillus fonticola TaxID=379896 RepID=UPI000368A4B6|nr:YwiC-like family protein [Paenibacillus fonticola]
MRKQGIVIPHEHGGWAMVSVPFVVGMMAGGPQWMHLLLFLAWLFLYLSSYPFLQALKRRRDRMHLSKWGTIYGLIAVICLTPVLLRQPQLLYFGPVLLALLLVNIWYVKHKSERAWFNDLCAILIFSLGGAAAYLLSGGGWDRMMIYIIVFNTLFFMGSVFFVKSVFRERTNRRWLICAKGYHVLLLLIPPLLGWPWMAIAYLFPLIRTFIFAGKTLRPMKVGIIEIIGSVQYVLLAVMLL